MSSTFSSSHDPPSRTWWSLSPKSSNNVAQDLRRGYSTEKQSRHSPTKPSSITFNSLASAMGFKSKKHPSLAIQDRPVRMRPTAPPPEDPYGHYAPRQISKSTSSTRSRVDSLEPRTPADPQRDPRRSLLTLSDIDPFAVRTISAPHTPSDPNRLSSYSNSSIPDYVSKHAEVPAFDRGSYASSSSHSNQHGGELLPHSSAISPLSAADSNVGRKVKSKKSKGSLYRKQSLISTDSTLGSAWESLTHHGDQANIGKLGSSSTLTDKSRFSQSDPTHAPRPQMRARGMTDSGANQRPQFLQPVDPPSKTPFSNKKASASSLTSPRVIIRQPSVSRIGSPPSAPPRHELPPPPSARSVGIEVLADPSLGSASSSTLSFASSVSSNKDILVGQPYSPRQKEKRPMERAVFPSTRPEGEQGPLQNQPMAPRTLKKALSHQSLIKHTSTSLGPIPTSSLERPVERAPRKQRSFHQPKAPIPPVPTPMRSLKTFGSQPFSTSNSTPLVEQRRGSAGGVSTSGRKRLFSGSSSHRRPSTSQCIMSEDDSHSVFSVRSDPDPQYDSSFLNPLSPVTTSFWDERTPDITPISPNPAHEYMPQQIMSPAEMAEVEASVEESAHIRKRGLSILSTSTSMTSDGDEETVSSNMSPALLWDIGKSDSFLTRSTSLLGKGLTVPLRVGLRPSTSQANMTTSPSNSGPSNPSSLSSPSSPSQAMTSLPPPPRPRQRPVIVPRPLSEERTGFMPLPPPPARRYLRPKVSVEKALHRRSIMRKPSFLEIGDDSDQESDVDETRETNSSFLNLGRESFDTVHTIDE